MQRVRTGKKVRAGGEEVKVGMMWFDPDKEKTPAERIERGAAFFEKKFGERPKACHVHPGLEAEKVVNGIQIEADAYILPGHMWFLAQGEVEG